MSSDASRFNQAVYNIIYLVVGSVQTLIATVILFPAIGSSYLAGLAVALLFCLANGICDSHRVNFRIINYRLLIFVVGWMIFAFGHLRTEIAGRTDERIRKVNEILSGMRVIKMFAWEKSFVNVVEHYRRFIQSNRNFPFVI